ncbi:hypothetical protein AMECASPLE_035273 [Ameca splendens]|uniref:Uncharacterized protein n=1 Tax=Ameca splendens TaxID=208324 RepID=A0ABV0XWC4_9TELE
MVVRLTPTPPVSRPYKKIFTERKMYQSQIPCLCHKRGHKADSDSDGTRVQEEQVCLRLLLSQLTLSTDPLCFFNVSAISLVMNLSSITAAPAEASSSQMTVGLL